MARPQTVALVGLWAGATGLAVGMASGGVNLVTQQVRQPTSVIIPGTLTDEPMEPGPTTVTATPLATEPPKPSSPATEPDASDNALPPSPQDPRPSATSTQPPAARPAPSPAGSEDRFEEPDDEPSDDDLSGDDTPESEPSEDSVAEPETRTITTRGGQASFEFVGDEVNLLWAAPADGFTVTVLQRKDDKVELVFRSSSHESYVEAKGDRRSQDRRIKVDEEPRDEDDREDSQDEAEDSSD